MAAATLAELLGTWIGRDASPDAHAWLDAKRAELARDPSPRALGFAFSVAGRRLGKTALALGARDLAQAEAARPGWRPAGLTLDQAARQLLLVEVAARVADFPAMLKTLVSTADLAELIAILRGLPLYPAPASLLEVATTGLRTSIRPVFEAVAHANPYPAEAFPQSAWNQMVLKALFIGAALHPIAGLDRRWNAELAAVLVDYAHERWAAGRPVSAELWRGVGRFADAAAVEDLSRVLASDDPLGRAAAALALHDCPHPAAAAALAAAPGLAARVAAGEIDWDVVSGEAARVQGERP